MSQTSSHRRNILSYTNKDVERIVLSKLRKNAIEKTEPHDISGKHLPKLEMEAAEHPQLETLDFYSGSKTGGSSYDFVPQSAKTNRRLDCERREGKRKLKRLEEILENFDDGQITFVGQAGSGKSTLLKFLTRQIIDKKYENLRDIEMIHFVHLRQFDRNHFVTPAELLFSDVPGMTKEERKSALRYARENPKKVLFVIDSLDTIPYTIDGVYTGIVKLNNPSSPESILYHLLSGNLLPGCRFITSSREYAIRNYKGSVQAKEVIALSGLSEKSMENIVVGYLGKENGEETMRKLERKPIIQSLCATPVWLIFTLMALRLKPNLELQSKVGIMLTVLKNMIRSEHALVKIDEEFLQNLAKLAFTGTIEHSVEFSSDKLSDFGLTLSQLKDLMVVTPAGDSQNLFVGDAILMFSHQSLQELFSAFHIARKELKDYEEFTSKEIHEPHFAVVRELLGGIMLNPEVSEEAQEFLGHATDFEEKRQLLKRSLQKKLKECIGEQEYRQYDLVKLFTCLTEAGNGVKEIIRNQVDKFDCFRMPLSPNEVYSIGWIMNQQTYIEYLNLNQWDPDFCSFSALHHALRGSKVQLHQIKVFENYDLGSLGMKQIAELCNHGRTKILCIESSDLTMESLQAFYSAIAVKLDEICFSWDNFGSAEMELVAKIGKQCMAKILRTRDCELSQEALESFLNNSTGWKLDEVDFSWNNFGSAEMELVAMIGKQCMAKVLRTANCKLSQEALESFLNNSTSWKLDEIDFSENNLDSAEMRLVAKIGKQCMAKVLRTAGCKLSQEALESFLNNSAGWKLDEFDVSQNTFGSGHCRMLGRISTQLAVERLILQECTFKPNSLKTLLVNSFGHKFLLVDVGRVGKLADHDREVLGRIFKQCGVEDLGVFSTEDLADINPKSFNLTSGDIFKINRLVYIEYPYGDETSLSDLQELSTFIPYITEEIDATRAYDASARIMELQNLLDGGRPKNLKIIYKDEERQKKVLVAQDRSDTSKSPGIAKIRRAKIVDGVISVSWRYNEENQDVRFHVQAFVNNQPMADIKICEEKFFECKTPESSKIYCFKIWAVDSSGIAGEAMFTNEVATGPADVRDLLGVSSDEEEFSSSAGASTFGFPHLHYQGAFENPHQGYLPTGGNTLGFHHLTNQRILENPRREYPPSGYEETFPNRHTTSRRAASRVMIVNPPQQTYCRQAMGSSVGFDRLTKRGIMENLPRWYPPSGHYRPFPGGNTLGFHHQTNQRVLENPRREYPPSGFEETFPNQPSTSGLLHESGPTHIGDAAAGARKTQKRKHDILLHSQEQSAISSIGPKQPFFDSPVKKMVKIDPRESELQSSPIGAEKSAGRPIDLRIARDQGPSSFSPDDLTEEDKIRSHAEKIIVHNINKDQDTVLSEIANTINLMTNSPELEIEGFEGHVDIMFKLNNLLSKYRKTGEMKCSIAVSENASLGREWLKHGTGTDAVLSKGLVMTLTTIDISYNKNFKDYELLRVVLQDCHITCLKMVSCNLKDENLRCLGNPQGGKITHLNISYNSDLTETGYRLIPNVLKRDEIKSLVISGSEIPVKSLTALQDSLDDKTEIESLDLSYTEETDEEWVRTLCKLMEKHCVSEFAAAGCNIDVKLLSTFRSSLKGSKLHALDLSDNPALRSEMGNLGVLLREHEIAMFTFTDCMPNVKSIVEFTKGLGDWKVSALNLSDWERNATMEYIKSICELIPHVKENLTVCFAKMNEKCRSFLFDNLTRHKATVSIIPGSFMNLNIIWKELREEHIEKRGFTIQLQGKSHVLAFDPNVAVVRELQS